MEITTGTKLGPYAVIGPVDAGGMGVVYKAEDARLERFVALKLLPEDMAHDRVAMERFRREAKAASALNHPNICTIYDIGEADGQTSLAMEYLEGCTFKKMIHGRGMELDADQNEYPGAGRYGFPAVPAGGGCGELPTTGETADADAKRKI